jgi:hypothetical protein
LSVAPKQVRDSFEACHITAEFAAGIVPTRSSPDGAIAIIYAKIVSVCPRDQREYVDRMDELYGFLEQSNISRKNIVRLEILAQHVNNDVRHLAMLILEVARVKPHKRRRWKFLAHNHFGLYLRLKELWGDDTPDEVPDFPDLADSDVPF